ncbi:universal stress protein [Flavobacterium sp. JP2137]|uniref:universal stress protein n=1 Tax=Flavobacterium sp. JP2137 TaxID=3414510 RepID=UPI003D2FC8A1
MKKILFPTDFSDTANNALVYALKMAENRNATLYVLHAYEMPVISATANPMMIQDVYKTIELGRFENFKDQVPPIRQIAEKHDLGHIPMHFILEEGYLNSILKKIIKDENIDMVVMGTSGLSGFEKKILGSNTANAISTLTVPVLSVPHDAVYKSINAIAFTTVFDHQDDAALTRLLPIAERNNAVIKCLHVSNDGITEASEVAQTWKQKYSGQPVEFHFISSKETEKSIFEFIDKEQIDLIASVTRNRNFFEKIFTSSLTKKLTYHTNIPVLVYHEH